MEQNNGLGADVKNGNSATDSNVNGNNGGGFAVGVRDFISLSSNLSVRFCCVTQ